MLMPKFKLNQITLGMVSGENEADYIKHFENLFYDYDNISENILLPNIYYLVGRKGTGKSILARYIEKQHELLPKNKTKVISFRNFLFHQLLEFKDKEFKSREYFFIWKWCLLINMASLLISDDNNIRSQHYEPLRIFLDNNYGLDLNQNKIIDSTKKYKLSGGFKSILSGNIETENKTHKGIYLDYIEELSNIITIIGSNTDTEYLLFCDDLDDGFNLEDLYKESLGSLIYAVDDLNRAMWKNGAKIKVVLLLRSDIFQKINFPDLNKFKIDNSLFLDWKPESKENSPLFTMVMHKIRRSVPAFSKIDEAMLFHKLFPERIDLKNPSDYIIHMSIGRPRDFISMLSLIIKSYPSYDYFGKFTFGNTKLAYSRDLLDDIKNEMKGHVSDTDINNSIYMIKNLGKSNFYLNDLKKHKSHIFSNNDDEYIFKLLKLLYEFSVIGNLIHDQERPELYYHSWAHREDSVEPDYFAQFTIHIGLRPALKALSTSESKC